MKLLIFIGFITIVQGQTPFLGRCPEKPVVEQFDVKQYLGRWYEIEKYFTIFEVGGTCVQTYYTSKDNGSIGVMNSQIVKRDGRMRSIQGTARPLTEDGSAKFGVSFDTVPFVGEATYFVLDTDYKNYSIVWSCTDYAVFNLQIVWFLSRDKDPSLEIRDTVHEKMNQLSIRRDLLTPTNQTNCDSL